MIMAAGGGQVGTGPRGEQRAALSIASRPLRVSARTVDVSIPLCRSSFAVGAPNPIGL